MNPTGGPTSVSPPCRLANSARAASVVHAPTAAPIGGSAPCAVMSAVTKCAALWPPMSAFEAVAGQGRCGPWVPGSSWSSRSPSPGGAGESFSFSGVIVAAFPMAATTSASQMAVSACRSAVPRVALTLLGPGHAEEARGGNQHSGHPVCPGRRVSDCRQNGRGGGTRCQQDRPRPLPQVVEGDAAARQRRGFIGEQAGCGSYVGAPVEQLAGRLLPGEQPPPQFPLPAQRADASRLADLGRVNRAVATSPAGDPALPRPQRCPDSRGRVGGQPGVQVIEPVEGAGEPVPRRTDRVEQLRFTG